MEKYGPEKPQHHESFFFRRFKLCAANMVAHQYTKGSMGRNGKKHTEYRYLVTHPRKCRTPHIHHVFDRSKTHAHQNAVYDTIKRLIKTFLPVSIKTKRKELAA